MTRDRIFESQSLADARFHDCALTRATFTDVDLGQARFDDVNLRGARIRDVNLADVRIENANIKGLMINGHDIAALIAARPRALDGGLAAQAPRAFLPTLDFAASVAFYEALGFRKLLEGEVAIFSTGPGAFILTRRHDPVWAENAMMQLMVDDLVAWWRHVEGLDLATRFGVAPPRAPALQPWGLSVAYLVDPAGVLWHVAQRRAGNPAG